MTLHLAVLTTGRQDFGILRSTCERLQTDARFRLSLWVGGAHVSDSHGLTWKEVAAHGFDIDEKLAWLDGADTPGPTQAARALEAVSAAIARRRPDALLLVGDRLETAAAALAATLVALPLVHLHGGEESEGAFDNALRHAITKMSHLHLVSHPLHAARVTQMGEDPASVIVVGAPGLDNLRRTDLPSRGVLESDLGQALTSPVVIVTLHPATLGAADDGETADALVRAMDTVDATYVITLPNADPGSSAIRARLEKCRGGARRIVVDALGAQRYAALLGIADAMLGNSSSGLIEAPAVGLPVVNVGDRQRGRLRGDNVIDCGTSSIAIAAALREALSSAARMKARASAGLYGDGRSAPRVVEALAAWTPPRPPVKRFHMLTSPERPVSL